MTRPFPPPADWPNIYNKDPKHDAAMAERQKAYEDRVVGAWQPVETSGAHSVTGVGKVKVRWTDVADRAQWSKTTLRQSTPAEIEHQRQSIARQWGVEPSAVAPYPDGTIVAQVSAAAAAAAAKDAACTERALPYLVAQARAAGFGKPEDGDSRVVRTPSGIHEFNDARMCMHCGVSLRKYEDRGGACRFVAEPASPVHVEPGLGRAIRKVREFDVMLGAVRWMAPK